MNRYAVYSLGGRFVSRASEDTRDAVSQVGECVRVVLDRRRVRRGVLPMEDEADVHV